jgi:hypothetical protein
MDNNTLPEYISGIPTAKKALQERREFVSHQYKLLLSKLINKTKKKIIHNDFLDVDVHLIYGEGGKEATNRGVFNWQSAYAILKLETIVKKATAKVGSPIYISAKSTGNQKNYKYVNMAVLYYNFTDSERWYMNFTVKLILGIKSDGRHIQYSINKIDIDKKITLY